MFARFRIPTLAAAALALAAPAAAQPSAGGDPLARFSDPVCPGVAGLQREAAEGVVGRIRANVEAFGGRLAPNGDCEANLLVVLVDDGKAFLEQLKVQRGYLFAELDRDERVALLNEPGPAWAFLRVRDYSRDGMPVYRRENLVDVPQTWMWMAHSKIYTATRRDIHTALIVFERGRVGDLTLDQLADYATFRAMAQTLPDLASEGERQASILSLFDGGERAAGLTTFDRAWLGQLYRGLPNMPRSASLAELDEATRGVAAE